MIRFPIAARFITNQEPGQQCMTIIIRLVLTVIVVSVTSVSLFAQSKRLSRDGRVIDDLERSILAGYKPTKGKRDGSWRRVLVQIANRTA
jgi:hypothetical protein